MITTQDLEYRVKHNTCGKGVHSDKNAKVKFVWNIEPQEMLNYCIEADEGNMKYDSDIKGSSHYIGMTLGELREIFEDYNGLQEMTTEELIQNGYYRLEIR